MTRRQLIIAVFSLILLLTLLLMSQHSLPKLKSSAETVKALPDFSTYTDVNKKKQAFFEFLNPVITAENKHIITLRKQLIEFDNITEQGSELSSAELEWIQNLSDNYRMEYTNNLLEDPDDLRNRIKALLLRIDTIPHSMVLSQAAIESGWGSSRFARTGNNLFGQWCFKKGCGIVPKQRHNGKQHEVARFENINDSVRAYMNNLNSFPAYRKFRNIRFKARSNGIKPQLKTLITGLENYSEQGKEYILKVARIIKQNKLEHYDVSFESDSVAGK